jgi:hypothetical protein
MIPLIHAMDFLSSNSFSSDSEEGHQRRTKKYAALVVRSVAEVGSRSMGQAQGGSCGTLTSRAHAREEGVVRL